jgi:hypothetical protein
MPKPVLFHKEEADIASLPRRLRSRLGADYIPGYSEIVMANDLSESNVISTDVKEKYYSVDFGTGPSELPVEFKWVPVVGPDGNTSFNANEAVWHHKSQGYKPVTLRAQTRETAEEEFRKEFVGFGFPPAAELSADGMVRHRDAALFYVDREVADRIEKERMEENKRFLGHNQPDADSNLPDPYDLVEEDVWTSREGSQRNL